MVDRREEGAPPVWAKGQLWAPLAVVDVETTGRDPSRHRVVECGLILLGTDLAIREQRVWALSINDDVLEAAEPAARALWRERLEPRWAAGEAVSLASWARDLVYLVHGHRLAAWRIAFDQSFLEAELRRTGLKIPWDFRESLDVPSWLEGLGWRPRSLREAAERVGLVPWAQHDALADALATAEVIRGACGIYGPSGEARGCGTPGACLTEERDGL